MVTAGTAGTTGVTAARGVLPRGASRTAMSAGSSTSWYAANPDELTMIRVLTRRPSLNVPLAPSPVGDVQPPGPEPFSRRASPEIVRYC